MLAIALSALVLYLVSMAIDLNMRSLDQRGQQVEEAQLARVLLHLIADDLRSVVYVPPTDDSSQSAAGDDSTGEDSSGLSAGSPDDSTFTSASSDTSMGISDLSYVPTQPGLYGTQSEIQIDISRLPRPDQYQRLLDDEPTGAMPDQVSEVKTVAYYVLDDSAAIASDSDRSTANRGLRDEKTGGLFRRQLDRAATVWAAESGNLASLDASAELLAPEVTAVEFRYTDGLQWYDQWDSETFGSLPAAVEVTIAISMTGATENRATSLSTTLAAANASGGLPSGNEVYQLLVRLPTAEAISEYDTVDLEGSSP